MAAAVLHPKGSFFLPPPPPRQQKADLEDCVASVLIPRMFQYLQCALRLALSASSNSRRVSSLNTSRTPIPATRYPLSTLKYSTRSFPRTAVSSSFPTVNMSTSALTRARILTSHPYFDRVKTAVFLYVILTRLLKVQRHLRARGVASTIRDSINWLKYVCLSCVTFSGYSWYAT